MTTVLGPFLEIIDTWLTEDERLPRKQRHTARRIFHRLRDEHDFPGGERTVREYVAKRRQSLQLEKAERFERLEHPGGEAQADFGTVYIIKSGVLVERKVLTLSFPYSNAAFVFPVPKENTECFLEALTRIFTMIDGVPRKIWFDNLSAAVVSIDKGGKRELTDAFMRFIAHYRFDPLFCNPYSGNEKGNVENKVGYGRRNWCVPPPVIDTPEQFEIYLAEAAKADRQREHYAKGERIDDLWVQEQPKLLHMPTVSLEIFRLETGRLNKYGELQFETTLFPLPQCQALQNVLLKVKWDAIEVLSADGEYTSIANLPRPYTEKTIPMDWAAIFEGYQKRPRSVQYSTFIAMMPESVQAFVRTEDLTVCKSRIALVCRLLRTYTINEIGEGLDHLTDINGEVDITLEHALYAKKHPEFHPHPFAEPHTPDDILGHVPTLDAYDQLLEVRMS